MTTIERPISSVVVQQFPEFYHTEGPNFVHFVKTYYEWLEQSNNALGEARTFIEDLDIDSSLHKFVHHYKLAYLVNVPHAEHSKQPFQIKNIQDLYRNKGTPEGIELFFRLVFGEESSIYKPGKDILKVSSGKWHIPRYLETVADDRNRLLVGQEITGATSGATAIVESVVRKNVKGKLIDVIFLSGLRGNFQVDEYITKDNSLANAPKVLGSLSAITIVDGGFGISNGDLFDISGASGKYGTARVVSTINGNGQVDFVLTNGGSGYNSNSTVVTVSNTVLFHGNTINGNNYTVGETVVQNVYSFTTSNNSIPNTSLVSVFDSSNTLLGNAIVYFSNTTSISISVDSGNLSTADKIVVTSNTISNCFVNGSISNTANAIVMAVNATAVGLKNVNGTFIRGTNIRGLSSNVISVDTRVSTGSNAYFTIREISNNELANSQYIGSILSIRVYPGQNYDTAPMITITNPNISGAGKYDWTVGIANVTGTFLDGQLSQAASGVQGTIRTANATHLDLIRLKFADTLANNQQIVSYFSNGQISGIANIISVSNNMLYTMGNNAIVNATATSLSGVVSEASILDSGYGYLQDEVLTCTSITNTEMVFTGTANLIRQGVANGHWEYNNSRLNSNKYIHDNDYYQEFSYEIQTKLSVDKYADILKKLMHVAGTKMFGRVVKDSTEILRLDGDLSIEIQVGTSGAMLVLNSPDETQFTYFIGWM